MAKNIKALLAQKLAENNQRHAAAYQEIDFDVGRQHTKLAVDSIDPNPYQPRQVFPQQELEALAASIAEAGLLQPISVRKVKDRYQLIAGERRWRAYKLLGRSTIEALVNEVEESDLAVLALVENIDREDLSDYEIGKALRQVEELFPTRKKLAETLGLNREDMYRYFAFEALPDFIRHKLDLNPRLLSRAAAADIKRVLKTIKPPISTDELLDRAWVLLESGSLEQTKIAAYLLREAKTMQENAVTRQRNAQKLIREGKQIGSISQDTKHFVIKLNITALNDNQMSELRSYVEQLLKGSV